MTALGVLHEPDQPLEPFILSSAWPLILPVEFFDAGENLTGVDLDVCGCQVDDERLSLIAFRAGSRPFPSGIPFVSLALEGKPRTHGSVRGRPGTLAELHEMLTAAELDLLEALRGRMIEWRTREDLDRVRVLLVVRLPKTRVDGGDVEEVEVWAFLAMQPLAELAEALGIMAEGVPLVGGRQSAAANAPETRLDLLNPTPFLTADAARRLNGICGEGGLRLVAIGAGALGSQVVMNLARAGWGNWTIIDDDALLPHNLARHALGGHNLGFAKAEALHAAVGLLYDGRSAGGFFVKNAYTDEAAVAAALDGADIVVDMAASVAVSRSSVASSMAGRRIALFLNPAGTDLVLLAEDVERQHRLDELEMAYYRALLEDPGLAEHLALPPGRITLREFLPRRVFSGIAGGDSCAVRHRGPGTPNRRH
jgi:hypothetical protein